MRTTHGVPGSNHHAGRRGATQGALGLAPFRALAALALFVALFLLPAAAFAQSGQAGTSIVLPDGSICAPLAEAERFDVGGVTAEHACGDDGATVLVAGLLESGGRAAVEAVRVDPPLAQAATDAHEIVVFDIRRLVLANGAECRPLTGGGTTADGRQIGYECQADAHGGEGANEEERLVLVGPLTHDGTAVSATLARSDGEGELQGEERLLVTLIDGSLAFTDTEWELASFGVGEDPPLAGAAPTLVFGPGRVGGNATCNSFFASITSRGQGELRVGLPGATLMACPDDLMSQEFRFLRALEGVTGYELVDDRLYLFGGAEVMTFAPQAAQ